LKCLFCLSDIFFKSKKSINAIKEYFSEEVLQFRQLKCDFRAKLQNQDSGKGVDISHL